MIFPPHVSIIFGFRMSNNVRKCKFYLRTADRTYSPLIPIFPLVRKSACICMVWIHSGNTQYKSQIDLWFPIEQNIHIFRQNKHKCLQGTNLELVLIQHVTQCTCQQGFKGLTIGFGLWPPPGLGGFHSRGLHIRESEGLGSMV